MKYLLTLVLVLTMAALIAVPSVSAESGAELPLPHKHFDSAAQAAFWKVAHFDDVKQRALDAERPWNGSIESCDAGSRTAGELDAVVELINLHRDIAGAPRLLGTDQGANRLAQEAALIMEANGTLTHAPDPASKCWSEDGDTGAGTSVLWLGSSPLAVQVFAYLADPGPTNLPVAHRRTILSQDAQRFGIGATDRGAAINIASSQDDGTPRAMAWPAAGPIPARLVETRWHIYFSYHVGADLSEATVRVLHGGEPVPIDFHGHFGGVLTWNMPVDLIHAAAEAGPDSSPFRVILDNVVVDGSPQTYSYVVEVVPDRFSDDDGGTFEADAIVLAADGVTKGCNRAGTHFCPEERLTRGQLAAMLTRSLDLPPASRDWFTDDDSSIFEDDINRLREAGVTRGCDDGGTSFCPERPISRAEIATFFDRAFDLPPTSKNWFTDDDSSVHEAAIDRFRAAEITLGCNPPKNNHFCPADAVTRGQIAAFFVRSDLVSLTE